MAAGARRSSVRDACGVTVYHGDAERADLARAGASSGPRARLRARGQLVGPAGPARPVRPGLGDLPSTTAASSATTSSSSTSRAPDGTLRPLPQHNVDVGMGLERITCLLQGVESVYDTDLFTEIRGRVRALTSTPDTRAERIVCDHVRSGVFLIADGVLPSNSAHGYVLRRLLRRAIRQGRTLGIEGPFLREVGETSQRRRASSTCSSTRSAASRARSRAACARSSGSTTSTAACSSASSRPTGSRRSSRSRSWGELDWREEFERAAQSTAGAAAPARSSASAAGGQGCAAGAPRRTWSAPQ